MKTLVKGLALAIGLGAAGYHDAPALTRLSQQQVGGERKAPPDQAVVPDMDKQSFQRGFVDPLRKAMQAGSCDERSAAFANFMGASAQLTKLGTDIEKYFGPDDNELVNTYVPAMRDQCTKEAYDRCVEKHDFGPLRLLGSQRARQAELLNTESSDATYDELWEKCISFELAYESLTEVDGVTQIRVKSMIPLTVDKSLDQTVQLILKGEAPLDPSAQAVPMQEKCRQTLEGPTPREPFTALRVAVFVDTTGTGALRKERERIREGFTALAAEEKEGKDESPGAQARRKSRRAWLERDLATLERAEAKQQHGNLNKPARIELDFLPGDIDFAVLWHCPRAPFPIRREMLFYGSAWPSVFSDRLEGGIPRFVFQPGDIHGGEQYAQKEVKGTREKLRVTMKFTLWHRPRPGGLESS